MNREEQIAQEYLHTISSDVVYEPDGKVPPDFMLNQIIGVEVRRLNQNILKGKKPKALEQERIKLHLALSKVFREFDSLVPVDNYWIGLDFLRPIGKVSNIQRAAKDGLLNFLRDKSPTPLKIRLSPNVSITVFRANKKTSNVFKIGVETDQNSGGWVGPLYAENINYCIQEKTLKIHQYRPNYSEWWLILIDYLAGGIGEPEKTFVIQHINRGIEWKKIIIIHPATKKEIIKID